MHQTVAHPSDSASPKTDKRPSARSTMPDNIAKQYTEVPTALWEHGGELDLDAATRALVVVMWSHRWYADSKISAGPERLAELSGLAVKTVRRRISELAERGLLRIERRGASKYAPVTNYDLSPLWEALAELVPERPSLRVVRESTEGGQSDQQGGQSDQLGVVTVTTEVEEVELDEVEGGAAPARTHDPTVDELIAQLGRDVGDPNTFPSTRVKLLEEIRELERRKRSQGSLEALERLTAARP